MVGVAYMGGATYESKEFPNSTTAKLPDSNNLIILIWQLSHCIIQEFFVVVVVIIFERSRLLLIAICQLNQVSNDFAFCNTDDVYVRKQSERRLEGQNQEQEEH